MEYKLHFIAPEQTGRVQATPDVRTDVYRLGMFFWNLLAGDLPFKAASPLEIIQHAFSRNVPRISAWRLDVPDALSAVIQKMTQKNVEDRYNSIAGVKWDLLQIQQYLSDGDSEGLRDFTVGSQDVNSLFQLPSMQVGREKNRRMILNAIERVAGVKGKQKRAQPVRSGLSSTSDEGSSLHRGEAVVDGDTNSDAGSAFARQLSNNGLTSPSSTRMEESKTAPMSNPVSTDENGSLTCSESMNGFRPYKASKASAEMSAQSVTSDMPSRALLGSTTSDGNDAMIRNSSKWRRKGTTELVFVSGSAGLGKSSLVSSVLSEARGEGYVAGSKFDQVKSAPFDPCLKALSSIMQQIFSEPDVSTDFHESLRTHMRQVWPLLSQMLGLPHWLLDKPPVGDRKNSLSVNSEPRAATPAPKTAQQKTADFFRYGTCARSSRFVAVYLDVLRFLADRRFVLIYLDDLQYADDESLNLLESLVAARIPAAIILTMRDTDEVSVRVNALSNARAANVTKIGLAPLNEDQISEYVTTTLRRSKEYCFSLVAVLQQRTNGIPFFIKEMLETCYRTRCLWYEFSHSHWVYSLDRVYKEFESQDCAPQITNDRIKKRILDLSPLTVSLLKWSSLLGSSFNFIAVRLLLRDETYNDSNSSASSGPHRHAGKADLVRRSSTEAVRALQEAVAAYILESDEGDNNQFRWCHERFLQAALSLCEDAEQMHFKIAQLMVTDRDHQHHSNYVKAVHICEGAEVIRKRVAQRGAYRKVLLDASESVTETGGRAQGLEYLTNCLLLLQPQRWDASLTDVDYQETLHICMRAAECYFLQGQVEPALDLLNSIFTHAHDAVDRVPAFVLKSRLHSAQGDHDGAFKVLKECLAQLDVQVPETTWKECDSKFHALHEELCIADKAALFHRPLSDCRTMTMRGSVLCDAIAAAFWSEPLLFYQLTLLEVELNLHHDPVTQAGLAYIHLAAVAAGRFNLIEFACNQADFALELLRKYHQDGYTNGRGQTSYCILVGHLQQPLDTLLCQLTAGLERSLSAGDTMMALLNIGFTASVKIWTSEDLVDVENFCTYGAEEIRRWQDDVRGGMFIVAARQFARALQGKTKIDIPDRVLCDHEHNAHTYMAYVGSQHKSRRLGRIMSTYKYYTIITQYMFGHYQAAVDNAELILPHVWEFWSSRFAVLIPFYTTLARFALFRERAQPVDGEEKAAVESARTLKQRLEAWAAVSDVNYAVYTHLLNALIYETEGHHDLCVRAFEAAQDAAELNCLHLDYGLATELSAEWLIRRGAKRLARSAILDAVAAYRRVSAFAKATQVYEKYEYLVRGCAALHSVDATSQTVDSDFPSTPTVGDIDIEVRETTALMSGHMSKSSGASQTLQADPASLGLDVLDLQSILYSSQILASELNFDRLLESMTKIIMDVTNATAFGLVQEDDEGNWIATSITDTRNGTVDTLKNKPLSEVKHLVGLSLIMSAIRFRETIYLPNVYEQTRFSMSAEDLTYFGDHKAIIVQPILRGEEEVLGVVLLHGRSFTQRNVTFLQLLVNAFSTSIINSKLFKEVEKVSANNAVMVQAQKHALEKARQSEQKAKEAEKEAMRNVKLKEEAARAKSMFLANVSHELRTPLNGVIGMSELLKGTTLSAEQESYADSIRVCADTLLTVINDILDYSKLEAGKMQMFSVELSLYETINEVVRALSYSNMQKELQTLVKLDLDPQALVLGDPVRLHQILMNLMSNSYKFTSKGAVTVSAAVDQEDEREATVTCSVADTGVGIPDEQKRKLFLPFSQADSSTARSYGGTGLGLSICKNIIEGVMKGKIWLESQVDEGTKVSFTLTFPKAPEHRGSVRAGSKSASPQPLAKRQNTADPMAIYSPSEDDAGYDRDRSNWPASNISADLSAIPSDQMNVLVAEDNALNQKIAIAYVKKLGYNCSAYPDGRQAVEALHTASRENKPFHIVLMDVQMPVLDGYNATREIRKSKDETVRNVLVIAMTASAIRGDREKCLESGMNSYLAKPVRQNVLKAMIDRWIKAPRAAAKDAVNDVHVAPVGANGGGNENTRKGTG